MALATLSFDDGGAGDIEVIRFLRAAHLPATFYLPTGSLCEHWYGGMHLKELQGWYNGFEIGAHGRVHLGAKRGVIDAFDEYVRCKGELERFFDLEDEIDLFAWPYGEHTEHARSHVGNTYAFARSVRRNSPDIVNRFSDRLSAPVTACLRGKAEDWAKVEAAAAQGHHIHACLHAWEIARGAWDIERLADLTRKIQSYGYQFKTNGEFFRETYHDG